MNKSWMNEKRLFFTQVGVVWLKQITQTVWRTRREASTSHIPQHSHQDDFLIHCILFTFCNKLISIHCQQPSKNDHHKRFWQGVGEASVLPVTNKQEIPLNSLESSEYEGPHHMIDASSNHSVTPHALRSGALSSWLRHSYALTYRSYVYKSLHRSPH